MAKADWASILSAEQVRTFWRDGYIVLERALSVETLARLQDSLDRLLARATAETGQNEDFRPEKGQRVLRVIDNYVRYGDEWWALVRHPVVSGAVCDLLGPDAMLHNTKMMLKPAYVGSAKEWHQDLEQGFLRPA